MKYIELKIHASHQGVEMVTEMLMRNGITSISVDDPADLDVILEKKNEYGWDYIDDAVKANPDREPVVKIWLDDTEEGREQLQHLKIEVMKLKSLEMEGKFGWDADLGRLYAESEVVDDEAWKDKWKEHFKPARITDRIIVCPSWEDYEAKAGELVIDIDPGMAFGTGTHETTRLCMALLQLALSQRERRHNDSTQEHRGRFSVPADETQGTVLCETQGTVLCAGGSSGFEVMDVGCGSGILSIGAALLGSRKVLGIEIDPDAVAVARENVEKNGLADHIEIREGDLTEGVDASADIIVANLMADLVMKLAPAAAEHLNEEGVFISSGILVEKKKQVADAIRKAGLIVEKIVNDGEWCAIWARKRPKKHKESSTDLKKGGEG